MEKNKLLKPYSFNVGVFSFKANLLLLSILFVIGFILLVKAGSYGLPLWDEADYIRAAGQAITDNILYLGSGFKPAFTSVIAFFFLIFGIKEVVAITVTIFFGLLTLYFTYLLCEKITKNQFISSISALLLGVTGYFLYYARVPRAESMAAFVAVFLLWFYYCMPKNSYNWYVLIGLLIGVSLWVRTTLGLMLAIIYLIEIQRILAKKISFKKLSINLLTITITVLAMYGLTLLLYTSLEPVDLIEQSGGYTFDSYNDNSANKIVDLIKSPFKYVNFMFYSLILWQLGGFVFTFFLVASIILHCKKIKKFELNEAFVAFIFLFLFLSFFPQHRYKVFFMAMPFAAILVSQTISFFKNKYVQGTIVALLILTTFIQALPIYTFEASSTREAASIALSYEPTGLLNSKQANYLFYGMFDNDANYFLSRDKIRSLQSVQSIEELQVLYAEGFTIIILDERGFDVPLREDLLNTDPIHEVENDIWLNDPILRGNYAQIPWMSDHDYDSRKSWIEARSLDDPSYDTIKIYKTEDVLRTAGYIQ